MSTRSECLVQCLDQCAALRPDALLYAFYDARGVEVERYSYCQFARRTAGLARALQERGLARGQRALLVYPPGLELIASIFACARIGVISVVAPIASENSASSANGAARLRSLVQDCRPSAVLTTTFLATHPATHQALPIVATDEILQLEEPFRDLKEDVLLLQYTSGSTGDPKGVVVTHSNVIANARALLDHTPVGVSWLPQFHDMGLIGYYLFPVVMGGRTHGFRPGDFLRRPELWLKLMSAHRATYASAPNFGFAYCLQPGKIDDKALSGIDLSALRVLLNGAEPVQPEVRRQFLKRFGRFGLAQNVLRAAYGLAEATLAVTGGGTALRAFDAESLRRGVAKPPYGGSRRVVELASCGAPLQGVHVDVLGAERHLPLSAGNVGEICLTGPNVTRGYWNRPPIDGPLRTGDLGFMLDGELYVCGRQSDTIIRRGQNYQPQDLEAAVNDSKVRDRGAAAYQDNDGGVALVVEASDRNQLPDLKRIAQQIVNATGLMVDRVIAVPARTIARTSSGKLSRAATRRIVADGQVRALASLELDESVHTEHHTVIDWLEAMSQTDPEAMYGPIGEVGIDSLNLVELQLELQRTLQQAGLAQIAERLDGPSLQHWQCREVLELARTLRTGNVAAARDRALALVHAGQNARSNEQQWMRRDMQLPLPHATPSTCTRMGACESLVLTGATGFFGPFILSKLLELTALPVYVLARGQNDRHARERVLSAMARVSGESCVHALLDRVVVWQSDLAAQALGLTDERWREIAGQRCGIFHNGAVVDYVRNYASLRLANVAGTKAVLDLAMTGAPKQLHYISSTFIFGWTRKGVLLETDNNGEMAELDFGYSQSKWVAEQLVHRAAAAGLPVAVYRPSLISVSQSLSGDTHDVAARLLAFMIRHGVAVATPNQISLLPADVLAHNLVTIAQQPLIRAATYHLTADQYHSLTELTHQITRDFGFDFEYFEIPRFIKRLNALASPSDPVYPLLDFFNRSAPHIEAMSLKRYSNTQYRLAREATRSSLPHPSLQEVAQRLVFYLLDQGWIVAPEGAG